MQLKEIVIKPADKKTKKYCAHITYTEPVEKNGSTVNKKKQKSVCFGSKNQMDYIEYSKANQEKADKQKELYIKRHNPDNENQKKKQDWSKEGNMTAGFWSRWLLWNLPTLRESVNNVKGQFDLPVVLQE